MSDPLEELASASRSEQPGSARHPLSRVPQPQTDKTPYIILITIGGLFALFVVLYVMGAFRGSTSPAPADSQAQRPQAQQPAQTRPAAVAARQPTTQRRPRPVAAAATRPADETGPATIDKYLDIKAQIDDAGNLRVTVKNSAPIRVRDIKIDVRTNFKEDATRTIEIPSIDPGKQVEVVNDYVELRRRDDPKQVPPFDLVNAEPDNERP